MDKNNINLNISRNTVSNTSPAPASQRSARAAVEQGHNSPEIAAELQNSPQVADPHYTRLMRLLALPNQGPSADELIHLFSKIENKDLQKKAYTKILESSKLSPEAKAKFTAVVQDPAIISEQEQAVDKALNPSLSVKERYAAARSIQNAQVQEQAFCAIVASVEYFSTSDLKKLKDALQGLPQSVQDGVFYTVAKRNCFIFINTGLKAAKLIKDANKIKDALYITKIINILQCDKASIERAISLENPDKQQETLCKWILSQLTKQYPKFSSQTLKIAKLIYKKDLQQKALCAIWEKGRSNVRPESLNTTLKAYNLLSPDLQNSVLRNELLKSYFDKCKKFNMEAKEMAMTGYPPCSSFSFQKLIRNFFDSANEEEKSTILFGIAKNINIDESFGFRSKDLLEEIYSRCPKELQKKFAYALLNQTLSPAYYHKPSEPYNLVLETFIPISSVCEEDIDGLIANVLSKEQPSFTVTQNEYEEPEIIVDPLYDDPFYHNYSYNGKSTFQDMCTAILDLYMPCDAISLEKKNLMIETMACNQSLSKDFRKGIIEKYIQDPALAEDLLSIVDQDLSDKRFKKTKLAARDEDQS